jgi:hypothetical protein
MSGKNIYGNLFREFMPLGSASASSGWNTATSANPINWATSQIGNKAAFFDNQKKLLYFIADVNKLDNLPVIILVYLNKQIQTPI